ncbi:hypothetical protein ABWH93_02870 [Seohaeicola saemankumensis]|uniref:hypothetical protein n=1 Tax=Seohaeicola TaxID=481178 RepID=UPI0026A3515D
MITQLRFSALMAGAALSLAACATPPSGTNAQDIANYEAAVASIGCTLITEPDYLAVGIQTGLSREQLLGLTQYQLAARRAESLPEGGIKLTTGVCA